MAIWQFWAICFGKKQSYLCNHFNERDLAYIFINATISVFQGNLQNNFNLHISTSQRQLLCPVRYETLCSYSHMKYATKSGLFIPDLYMLGLKPFKSLAKVSKQRSWMMMRYPLMVLITILSQDGVNLIRIRPPAS